MCSSIQNMEEHRGKHQKKRGDAWHVGMRQSFAINLVLYFSVLAIEGVL